MLYIRRYGTGSPLVALHGFTHTGAQFASGSRNLRRTIYAPDLPGHGFSATEPADLPSTASAVESLLESVDNSAPLVGYSMGGRIALSIAVEHPESTPGLILVSGTPGIEDPKQREERVISDSALAEHIQAVPITEFLDTWTSSGITDTSHVSDAARTSDRIIRQQNTSSGLVRALEGLGQGVLPPLWDRLDRLTTPVLLIHGERDTKYARVAHRMHKVLPNCTIVSIAASGHNPLLDAPDRTYEEISVFVEGLG